MSLNKVGFWAVTVTGMVVSFLMALDHLSVQGYLPVTSKSLAMTWGLIFVSIFVTVKLLSVFEHLNTTIETLKKERASAEWQKHLLDMEKDTVQPAPAMKLAVGGNVIPLSRKSLRRQAV